MKNNALVTLGLLETKQDCIKKLFKTVGTTYRILEFFTIVLPFADFPSISEFHKR